MNINIDFVNNKVFNTLYIVDAVRRAGQVLDNCWQLINQHTGLVTYWGQAHVHVLHTGHLGHGEVNSGSTGHALGRWGWISSARGWRWLISGTHDVIGETYYWEFWDHETVWRCVCIYRLLHYDDTIGHIASSYTSVTNMWFTSILSMCTQNRGLWRWDGTWRWNDDFNAIFRHS